jgi:hypothetical protein
MEISDNTKKMFNVLVVTGALLGATQVQAQNDEKEEIKCRLEMTKTERLPIINKIKSKTICLDNEDTQITLSEIDQMIKIEADENDCATPFCGCWLG